MLLNLRFAFYQCFSIFVQFVLALFRLYILLALFRFYFLRAQFALAFYRLKILVVQFALAH